MAIKKAKSMKRNLKAPALKSKPAPVIVEQTYNAPVARVWKALTDKDEMKCWYFDMKDFKPKVGFTFEFKGEDKGFVYLHHCRIKEVVTNKRLVHSWRYEGYGGDSQVTFELFAKGRRTLLRITHEGLDTFPKIPAFDRANFLGGWTYIGGTLLRKFVEDRSPDREIVLSRILNAPRERVWDAMTDSKQVVEWWGPNGFTTTTEKMDVRPGGVWKHIMHGPDGSHYPNKSIFTEVSKPSRLVHSHNGGKKGAPGVNFIATWTFEDLGKNKTRLTMHSVFPSAKERNTVAKFYRAIEGGKQTLARLADYLAKH